MSECLRYRRKDIRTHLSQQYVLGHLSARVKKRTETLIKQDQEFEQIVYQWQTHLSSLVSSVADQKPPASVWQALQLNISTRPVAVPWYAAVWRYAGAASFVLLCVISLMLWQQQPKIVERVPGYLAVMSELAEPQMTAFVLTAYQGAKPGQSILKLQWEQAQSEQDLTEAVLWTVERETGKRLKVGAVTELTNNQFLTKDAWLKIKNSAELQVSIGDKILFRGPCLQLAPWQES